MTAAYGFRAQNDAATIITLITLTHPSLTSPFRFSSDPTVIATDHPRTYKTVSRGQDFDYAPFEPILPHSRPGGSPSGGIAIADPDFEVVGVLEELDDIGLASLTMEVVRSVEPDVVRYGFENLSISRIGHQSGKTTVELGFDVRANQRWPYGVFSPASFPLINGGR